MNAGTYEVRCHKCGKNFVVSSTDLIETWTVHKASALSAQQQQIKAGEEGLYNRTFVVRCSACGAKNEITVSLPRPPE